MGEEGFFLCCCCPYVYIKYVFRTKNPPFEFDYFSIERSAIEKFAVTVEVSKNPSIAGSLLLSLPVTYFLKITPEYIAFFFYRTVILLWIKT